MSRNTSFTVTVRNREFASEFATEDPAVNGLIRRTVPAVGREWLHESRTWLIYSSRVPTLLAALQAAEIDVVDTTSEGATS